MPVDEQVTPESWRVAWRSPLRFSAILFGTLALLLFLWVSRSIFVASFLGLLFGVSMLPAVDWLHRFRIPRGVGAVLLVATFIAVLTGIAELLAPVLQTQAIELKQRLPEAIDRIDQELVRRHIGANIPAGDTAVEAAAQRRSPLRVILSQQIGTVVPYLFPFFSTTLTAFTGIILVLFLAIFFASDPGIYKRGVLHLISRQHRTRAAHVLETMGRTLRSWFVARTIAMVTIGIVVTAAMALLNVRASVALGVIAGLLEFVPVFGPILGAIPAIALGLVDSPQKALAVFITFVIIQQLEGNVLIPILLQKAVEVPPALSLIGIASLGMVLGILGVFIAEPLVAAALVAVKMLYVEPIIGDDMNTD